VVCRVLCRMVGRGCGHKCSIQDERAWASG
jgi:hypothetical protein